MKDSSLAEGYDIGVRALDGEHDFQISLLRAYRHAVEGGRDQAVLSEIVDRLIDYTKIHFASEQMLMRLYHYPQFQDHMVDHDRTIEWLEDLRDAQRSADKDAANDVTAALEQHILGHIRSADRAFGHFLVRLGVGPG